jgi:undecaprenyl-diphosphatase
VKQSSHSVVRATGAAAVRSDRRFGGPRYLSSPSAALGCGAALIVAVVVVGFAIPTGPRPLDQAWAELMADSQTGARHSLALVFNALGRGLALVILAAIGMVLAASRRWQALAAYCVAEGLTTLIVYLIKSAVGRPRPPDQLLHVASASYPSGHTASAGATSVALVLLFTAPGRHRRRWWALAALGTTAMAWSRTYLQVHWLTDVIAGAMLGVGVTLVVFAVTQLGHDRFSDPR